MPPNVDLTFAEYRERLMEYVDESFRVIMPSTLKSVLDGERLLQPKEYGECLVSQLRTVVTPSGTYICPYFRGDARKKIGDLTKQSLDEVWKGERRDQVLRETDPSVDCRFHCIRHQSNIQMGEMLSGGVYRVISDFDYFI